MPWRRANCSAFPGVGLATATTSASSGIIFTDAAMQSAWKREPMIPIFTFDTKRLAVRVGAWSSPRGLAGRERHASHPLSRDEDPSPRLRHPDLGREVRARRELAHEIEVMPLRSQRDR